MSRDMQRRSFLKMGLSGLAGLSAAPAILGSEISGKKRRSAQEPKIIYRTLGKTGFKLPVVSMGVMNADNPNLVKAALDAGILHLDTAHGYQRGRNEEMIGQAVKDRPRDSFYLATKVGYAKDRKTGRYAPDVTAQSFQDEFDISLKRLDMDHVDILYIHSIWTKETVTADPVLKFLEKAKKDGKARFVGLTTHRNEAETIAAAVESGFYDVILTAYNFRQQNGEDVKRAVAKASQAGVGIVAMKTLAGGYWDREKQQPINAKAALKWALQDENVHTAIPGLTTFDQLELDLSVMEDFKLTDQEKADLRLDKGAALTGLYCQQCAQCLPQCPQNLPVPDLMRSYMYAYGYRNLDAAHDLVTSLELPSDPCGRCGTCRVSCRQGFDVKAKVSDIARMKNLPGDFFS